MDTGDLLRNFLLEYQRIRAMPPDVVRQVLFFDTRCPIPCQELGRRRGRKRKQPPSTAETKIGLGQEAPSSQ
jgi:hypothetical protein